MTECGKLNPGGGRWNAVRMVAAFILLLAARTGAQAPAATTVIVVRHAEKAAQPAADPPLTDAGVTRAKALEAALRDAGVTAIVTTQLERTKATARPLAEALHITPDIVPTEASVAEHVKKVAAAVMRHGGGVVLVVGHSNTVPETVEALGGKKPAAICDDEYDGMYVVVVGGTTPARVVHSRYGAASVLGASCASMR